MAVQSDVSLDIDQALRRIEELERALARSLASGAQQGAATVQRELQRGESIRIPVAPTVDPAAAGRVARDVTSAVDQADSTVAPVVDPAAAGRITTTVTGAIDTADAGVAPVVDPAAASRITGTVEGAIDAAGGTVSVTANVQGAGELQAACEQAKCVDDNLVASTDSAKGLGSALSAVVAVLVAAGAADFFRDSVLAAADLGEAVSKVQVVFGDAADGVLAFGANAGTSMGLANDEALGLASSMGVLFQATGVNQEASAELATSIAGLAGDLASFSNVQGGAAAAGEALSAALRGEAEPARALGIILNEEAILRSAVTNGIARQGEELNAQQKILATYHEIMRQTTLAQGDFARTADSLPNQLRTLSAEFRDTQVAIGQQLLPDVVTFIQAIRADGIPAIETLATAVVPALLAAMQNLLPLFTAGTQLLVAFAPTIEAVSLGLGQVPGPVIAVAGAALLLIRNLELLQKAFLATVTSPATLGFVALGVAIAGTLAVMGQSEQRAREQARAVDTMALAVGGAETGFLDLTATLEGYVLTADSSSLASDELAEAIQAAGLSAASLAANLAAGDAGFAAFLDDLVATGALSRDARDALVGMGADAVATSRGIGSVGFALDGADDATRRLVLSFAQEARTLDDVSERQARLAVNTGEATQQMFDQAVAANTASDGTVDWTGAIQDLTIAADEQAQVVARNNALFSQAAFSGDAARQVTEEQAAAIRELRGELDPFNEGVALTAEQMARLTQEIAGGSFTTQEFSALADELGVSVEALAEAEAAATESIALSLQEQRDAVQGWYDQLVSQIPDATAAFQGFNDEATIQEALDRFIMDSLAFAEAQGVLNGLLEGGFGELATFLATQPPAIIRQFAGATNEELQAFQDQIAAGNDILAVGAETAGVNAEALAGNVGTGWQNANQAIADADLAGAAQASVEDAGAAALTAAGTETSPGGAVFDAYVAGTNIGRALANGMRLQEVSVFLAGIRLGEAAIRGINVGAQIRSPSRLAYESGRQVALGYMGGFADTMDESVFATAGVATAGSVAATPSSGAFGAFGATGGVGAPGHVTVLVDLDGQPFRAYTSQVMMDERRAARTVARAGTR